MELVMETRGVDADEWLKDYVGTTIVFAVWRQEMRVAAVRVMLDGETDVDGREYVRCGLRAHVPGQPPVCAGATGANPAQAVCEAANLLEVALVHEALAPREDAVERLAA